MDALSRAVIRQKCEEDFLFFVRYFFKLHSGNKFVVNWHHQEIANCLGKCTTHEVKRLILNLPPRYSKTLLCVQMAVAWWIAKNPRAKFIHLSYSDELAFDNSSAIKELILSDEYQALWPHIKLKDDAKSKKKWYTVQGGGLYATSSGGAVTGFGAGSTADTAADDDADDAHLEELRALGLEIDWLGSAKQDRDPNLFWGAIIIDDPLKPTDAESATVRKTINGRMVNTIGSRVNSRKTPIIVIMQRLHEEDTTGFLLNGGTGEKWDHVCFSALYEENGQEKALWPHKHTVEELKQMREANAYVFSGQYQQTPTPAAGGVVKLQWFERYKEEPAEPEQIIFSCDTAFKPGQMNDPSVVGVFGKFRKRWYLMHVWRARVTYPELKRTVYALADRWKPHGILVEDKASGQSLIQDMREDGLPAISITPEANKQIRMDNQAPMLEAGLVLLPERAEWLYEFEQEAVHFPKGKHDDQIDALSQFLKWARNASLEFLSVGGDEWAEVAKEMGEDPDDWDDFDDDFD